MYLEKDPAGSASFAIQYIASQQLAGPGAATQIAQAARAGVRKHFLGGADL